MRVTYSDTYGATKTIVFRINFAITLLHTSYDKKQQAIRPERIICSNEAIHLKLFHYILFHLIVYNYSRQLVNEQQVDYV